MHRYKLARPRTIVSNGTPVATVEPIGPEPEAALAAEHIARRAVRLLNGAEELGRPAGSAGFRFELEQTGITACQLFLAVLGCYASLETGSVWPVILIGALAYVVGILKPA